MSPSVDEWIISTHFETTAPTHAPTRWASVWRTHNLSLTTSYDSGKCYNVWVNVQQYPPHLCTPAYPIPTDICLLASSRSPDIPEKMIITASGTAPRRGRTTPPMMAAGRPRSSSSSAPSTVCTWVSVNQYQLHMATFPRSSQLTSVAPE